MQVCDSDEGGDDNSDEGDDVYTTVDYCDSVKHLKAMNRLMSIDRYLWYDVLDG